MNASDLNRMLDEESGVIEVDQDVYGLVKVKAGTRVTALVIRGSVPDGIVLGGNSLPAANRYLAVEGTYTEQHATSGATRVCGSKLLYSHPGNTPALEQFTLIATCIGDKSKGTGIYGVHLKNCNLCVNVSGYSEHGIFLTECENVTVSGSIIAGIGTKDKTGGGYGIELASCRNCIATNTRFSEVRYGVSLSLGGVGNFVHELSGSAWVAHADFHGGGERDSVISHVPIVKPFNESWTIGPVNARFNNCQTILQEHL